MAGGQEKVRRTATRAESRPGVSVATHVIQASQATFGPGGSTRHLHQDTMDAVQIAWLAGLLEGEGSFLAAPPSDLGRARVALSMCDEDVVARVARLWGVSYCRTNHHERSPKWKPAFRVTLRGAKAIEVMLAVRPHMGTRRQSQIDFAVTSPIRREAARKLNIDKVREIRRRLGEGESVSALAVAFGVSRFMIRQVRDGLLWKRAA